MRNITINDQITIDKINQYFDFEQNVKQVRIYQDSTTVYAVFDNNQNNVDFRHASTIVEALQEIILFTEFSETTLEFEYSRDEFKRILTVEFANSYCSICNEDGVAHLRSDLVQYPGNRQMDFRHTVCQSHLTNYLARFTRY